MNKYSCARAEDLVLGKNDPVIKKILKKMPEPEKQLVENSHRVNFFSLRSPRLNYSWEARRIRSEPTAIKFKTSDFSE